MGFFDKKYCDVCGEKIGLLGNKKLEDANLCKKCAAKLSPFFSERRHSTLEEIKEQLAYREKNLEELKSFHVTRVIDGSKKIMIDEDQKKFVVTSARDLIEANPDIISFSDVTGCDFDIHENRYELFREDKEGKSVSYNPPRHHYSYDFKIKIHVNNPYFDEISYQLNPSSIDVTPTYIGADRYPKPDQDVEYMKWADTAQDIKDTLTQARQSAREEAAKAQEGPRTVTCPYCQAVTTVTPDGKCEYCGSSLIE